MGSVPHPINCWRGFSLKRGRIVIEATVSEIHGYPLRSLGYVEPLFATPESRREISEHLLRAPWLLRASEIGEKSGSVVHAIEEPVKLRRGTAGRVDIVRTDALHTRRCSWRRRRVVEVLMRWREVRSWWSNEDQSGPAPVPGHRIRAQPFGWRDS